MAIRFFDMFAGIGGFRSGLERLGGFECVGYCEIDKYTKQAYEALYNTEGELYFEDARTIDPKSLPNIDLICGGFPCQSFSIAGLRRGFEDDTRGTLFFEIARIATTCRPPFLLLENVPGLLSHDKGGLLRPSSLRWMNWGTMSHGKCLTARISESRNPENECTLSDILENDVPEKYYLSPKQTKRLLSDSFRDRKEVESIPKTESE